MYFLKRLALFWFLCAFFGLSGYFAIYNQDRVSLTLPPWIDHISVPAYIAFVVFFLIGSAVTWVYFGIEYTRKSLEVRKLTRMVRQNEGRALNEGRTMPAEHMPEVQ